MAAQAHTKGIGDERYRVLMETLRAARKNAGYSQQAFAERLGRHQQFVSRYETGERRLDVVEFCDVARALGIDPVGMLTQIA